jgi:hypothetical protein
LLGAQLKGSHPGADDDGLWLFRKSDSALEIQIESPAGMCPFLIEHDKDNTRLTTATVDETMEKVARLLRL